MAEGDTRHVVEIKGDQRGKYFLIGLAVIVLFMYWFFGGRFTNIFSGLFSVWGWKIRIPFMGYEGANPYGEGYASVSGPLIQMFIEAMIWLIVAIGFATSKAGAVVGDILAGLVYAARMQVAKWQAMRAAEGVAAATATGTAKKSSKLSADKLVQVLNNMNEQISYMNARLDKVDPPPELTPEEEAEMLRKELETLRSQIKEAQ